MALAVTLTAGNGHTNGAGHVEPLVAEREPRGRKAIRTIVAERPGLWSLADLREEMKRRGWFTSPKAVEVAVTRLCQRGEARKAGTGLYEFPAPVREEVAA